MKSRHKLSLAVIFFIFFVFSSIAFKNSLAPYVTFAEARTSKETVLVRGTLAETKETVAADGGRLTFRLRDEAGEEAWVVYAGAKPEGFEQADNVVAVGRYQGSQFTADKLLVKCPSKYQGRVKQ